MTKVKVGKFYKYVPCILDKIDAHSDAVEGDIVRVVNKTGCPPANTMGHCHIEDAEGKFLGLVSVGSLEKCPQPAGDKRPANLEQLREFIRLATGGYITGYNAEGDAKKRRFAKLGKAVAILVANRMGLESGTFEVRYNAGGMAGAGETTLHGEKIYIQFGQGMLSGSQFMYRACDGRSDYTGKANRWMRYADLGKINRAAESFKQVAASGR